MMKTLRLKPFLLILLIGVLLSACASPGVRGEPPFIQINGLRLVDDLVNLDLGIRNVNAEPMMIEHIEFEFTVENEELAIYKAASSASVSSNGMENLRFELAASPGGLKLLNDLQNGDHPNLEYAIEGVLQVFEDSELKVRREGRLYPVPGRPGQFR
jgi:LEA14-like dessication related protein